MHQHQEILKQDINFASEDNLLSRLQSEAADKLATKLENPLIRAHFVNIALQKNIPVSSSVAYQTYKECPHPFLRDSLLYEFVRTLREHEQHQEAEQVLVKEGYALAAAAWRIERKDFDGARKITYQALSLPNYSQRGMSNRTLFDILAGIERSDMLAGVERVDTHPLYIVDAEVEALNLRSAYKTAKIYEVTSRLALTEQLAKFDGPTCWVESISMRGRLRDPKNLQARDKLLAQYRALPDYTLKDVYISEIKVKEHEKIDFSVSILQKLANTVSKASTETEIKSLAQKILETSRQYMQAPLSNSAQSSQIFAELPILFSRVYIHQLADELNKLLMKPEGKSGACQEKQLHKNLAEFFREQWVYDLNLWHKAQLRLIKKLDNANENGLANELRLNLGDFAGALKANAQTNLGHDLLEKIVDLLYRGERANSKINTTETKNYNFLRRKHISEILQSERISLKFDSYENYKAALEILISKDGDLPCKTTGNKGLIVPRAVLPLLQEFFVQKMLPFSEID